MLFIILLIIGAVIITLKINEVEEDNKTVIYRKKIDNDMIIPPCLKQDDYIYIPMSNKRAQWEEEKEISKKNNHYWRGDHYE